MGANRERPGESSMYHVNPASCWGKNVNVERGRHVSLHVCTTNACVLALHVLSQFIIE